MVKQEQRDTWKEVTEIWGNSSKGEPVRERFYFQGLIKNN